MPTYSRTLQRKPVTRIVTKRPTMTTTYDPEHAGVGIMGLWTASVFMHGRAHEGQDPNEEAAIAKLINMLDMSFGAFAFQRDAASKPYAKTWQHFKPRH